MSSEKTDTSKRSGGLRRGILYSLLCILAVALVYDYGVARPNVNAAYDVLLDENQRLNAKPNEFLSNTDVQKLLKKEPSSTFNDGSSFVEVYQWPGGIPGWPHSLFAVYKDRDDQHMFYRQAKFIYDSSSEVSPIAELTIPPFDPDFEALHQIMSYEESSGTVDASEMMAQLDANGDGSLAGDEIPDHEFGGLDLTDTNGDKSISEDELTARVAEFIRETGSRPPRVNGDTANTTTALSTSGSSSRPPLEE